MCYFTELSEVNWTQMQNVGKPGVAGVLLVPGRWATLGPKQLGAQCVSAAGNFSAACSPGLMLQVRWQ